MPGLRVFGEVRSVALPAGVERRSFDGVEGLATTGEPVYGERTDGSWRHWSSERSKVAGMLERDMPVRLSADAVVLYLGAASGTTVSHVADIVRAVYAIEFSPRPMRDLVGVAETRPNVFPLLCDARHPETYAHVVEADVDLIIQDVATRGQAAVALRNKQFLASDGQLVMAIKARSEDVTQRPERVFETVIEELEAGYTVAATERLDPQHVDHLAVLAEPRA